MKQVTIKETHNHWWCQLGWKQWYSKCNKDLLVTVYTHHSYICVNTCHRLPYHPSEFADKTQRFSSTQWSTLWSASIRLPSCYICKHIHMFFPGEHTPEVTLRYNTQTKVIWHCRYKSVIKVVGCFAVILKAEKIAVPYSSYILPAILWAPQVGCNTFPCRVNCA